MSELEHVRERLWELHKRGMAAAEASRHVPRVPLWRPPLKGEAAVAAAKRCEEELMQVAIESAAAWMRGEVPERLICGAAIVSTRAPAQEESA